MYRVHHAGSGVLFAKSTKKMSEVASTLGFDSTAEQSAVESYMTGRIVCSVCDL